MAQTALQGNPVQLSGDLPAVGSTAPDFSLTAGDLSDVSLATYAGKKKLLNIVPSLDTGVCAASTRKFNETMADRAAERLSGKTVRDVLPEHLIDVPAAHAGGA